MTDERIDEIYRGRFQPKNVRHRRKSAQTYKCGTYCTCDGPIEGPTEEKNAERGLHIIETTKNH